MWRYLFLAIAAVFTSLDLCTARSYEERDTCKETDENLYKFEANEEYFGEENKQTFQITIYFKVHCVSVGVYGVKEATLYEMVVTDVIPGGNVIEREETHVSEEMPKNAKGGGRSAQQILRQKMSGRFLFVRTKDGSVPATYFSREEDPVAVNLKKAVVSAFQANFEGTKFKEEADPQSLHTSEYRYEASAQDKKDNVIRMSRRITTENVKSYADHIPAEEAELMKEEMFVYRRGILTEANGNVEVKLMTKENIQPKDDIEEDNLEAQYRRRRESSMQSNMPQDPDDTKTFDSSMKTNYYESKGSYKLILVGQRRILRKRSVYHVDMNVVESSLLAFINHTRKAMERMMELHRQVGNMQDVLNDLYMYPNKTSIAHEVEALIKLEAMYGPLPQYSPAINIVLDFLKQILGSCNSTDLKMRLLIYFIISREGSLPSQLALLEGLQQAVNDEELETVTIYIALVSNPHPEFISKLENLISSDIHTDDPLLLAYGGVISRASPELQQRMIPFLLNRLQQAENNSTSLIHHILSLGNTASPRIASFLIDYLNHPEIEVQLSAILAMRFIMNEPSVQISLTNLLGRPETSENHLLMVTKALLYGIERAKLNHEEKPYSQDFAEALVMLAVDIDNEELHSALADYLHEVKTQESKDLIEILQFAKATHHVNEDYSNTTRFRRGRQWDENNSVYNLVAPLSVRQADVRMYRHRLSYIWGKKFGGGDINAEVAAGGFAGVSTDGSYKLFGHAVARARCYDRSLTILDFLVSRTKSSSATVSKLYANVLGITLKNIRLTQDASVCSTREEPLYEGKQYTVFDFTYSVFVVVGTLNFRLTATVQFTTGMYITFCENQGSLSVGAGLSPTLTVKVSASGDLEIAFIAKAGLTLTATLNYQVLPEVTSELCYKQSQLRVKNCIGVYHQWANNELELYAWYAWRGWCGWWVCTGSDAYRDIKKINGLSFSWDLPGTRKLTIWKTCDQQYTC